jgi:polysaccharide export outer membrane protein
MINPKRLCCLLFVSVLLLSCAAHKQLPYLKKAAMNEKLSTTIHEAKIMPDDVISITVNSTLQGAVNDFNLPLVPNNMSSPLQTTVQASSYNSGSLQNYIVQKDGTINFPVLGTVTLVGMTAQQAQEHLASLIYPRYIAEKPIINVRFVNFQVSVLGEVNRPGTFNSVNGQMTILDALAAAGDMTIYGKRTNILLIRTNEKGETIFQRISLQDKNIVANSELFYMQQNDKLYVETNRAKGNNSAFGTIQTLSLSAVSIVISAASLVATLIKSN